MALYEWVGSAGAHVLNTGAPTRIGRLSSTAPDVTIVPPRFKEARWAVLRARGRTTDRSWSTCR